ncbi:hypothetical protein O5D80_006977 [Batrachochytrium dendrobatidis]|nr:hypothetical protein O5D80_006977 [Batrachochytrium dendrobatidis]
MAFSSYRPQQQIYPLEQTFTLNQSSALAMVSPQSLEHTFQTNKIHQEDFQLSVKVSLSKQLYVLTKKVILTKLRDRTSTLVAILTPVFILFILFILNVSLSTTISAPVPTALNTLSSYCPDGSAKLNCVSLGFTNSTPIDDIVTSLTSLVLAAEPDARILSFLSKDAILSARNANPTLFVVGVEFLNVSDLTTASITPSITYNIISNSTVISSYRDVRIDTAIAYVQTAILNVFRAKQNLPSLRSPLLSAPLYPHNGAPLLATIRGKATSGVASFLPYYFIYMLQPFFQVLLTTLVKEKSEKTKSGLIMMGTNDTMYMLSILIGNALFNIVTVLIVVLIVMAGGIFKYSSAYLLIVLLLLYMISLILLGCIMSIFISHIRQVSSISMFVAFGSLAFFGICQIFVWKLDHVYLEYLVMLVAPVALGRSLALTMNAESQALGLTLDSMSDIRVGAPFHMLALDIVLYWSLAWYLNKIFPGENIATSQPWSFPFISSFWLSTYKSIPSLQVPRHALQEDGFIENFNEDHISDSDRNVLSINNILKEFKVKEKPKDASSDSSKGIFGRFFCGAATETKIKRAVQDFNLNLHSSQILALLGHNGAGKTTLISMISGVVLPKSGHIYVKSKSGDKVMDITDPFALSMFRQELGVCPQFDVIFESLTVREHLELYCGIKGVTIDGRVGDFISSGQKEAANLKMQYVEAIARDVELYAKLDAYISTLSGGMRRKLSVAIALLGSPRIVLLDEPTTGMDVAAQQRIWSLIRSCKKNRVLILTTHSMEEADVLGDRIAIMSNGHLKTLGTSIFLKSQFGTGYSIDFVKSDKATMSNQLSTRADSTILKIVQQFFPAAYLETAVSSTTVKVRLAKVQDTSDRGNSAFTPLFADMYRTLQVEIANGELASIVNNVGLDLTTLEQVFMRFKEEEATT